jgi:hypothetical protein
MNRVYSLSFYIALVVLFALHSNKSSYADALVVTKAMKASTIAEIFIKEDRIDVKLEIGADNLQAFQNILPDELFEKLFQKKSSYQERSKQFLSDDFVISANTHQLAGQLTHVSVKKRIVRDEITGDPLPNQPEDAELVVQVELSYPLQTRPKTVSFRPLLTQDKSITTNIGFVVYHQGVAVNDFRYLSKEEKLQLDWDDPWYSAFESKNLKRRHFAPAAAFLYVENFEVRKEIVFRPKDLQHWVDLGLAEKKSIEAESRKVILDKTASFLAEHTPVVIDGKKQSGTLDRIHFIHRTLRTTGVVEEGKDIDLTTALIGAIYIYPIDSLPQNVTMSWELYNDRIQSVPTVATDEVGGMPGLLEPDNTVLVWKNFLKNPTIPAFLQVASPPPPASISIPVASILCLILLCVIQYLHKTKSENNSTIAAIFSFIFLLVGFVGFTWQPLKYELVLSEQREISDDESAQITYSLLNNIYRAFDYRDENTIYDVLEKSAAGELLTNIYLETLNSLTLASQGGSRVKVQEIEMVSSESSAGENGSFVTNCKWRVTGSVGHWGHIHQRINQYHGEFTIKVIDGQWKLINMELLDEQRL